MLFSWFDRVGFWLTKIDNSTAKRFIFQKTTEKLVFFYIFARNRPIQT